MKSVHIIVHGLVQGVFFRQHTMEKAFDLNIAGFVRNLPDGTVEIEAQGSDDSIKEFIAWCQNGPPRAEVMHVDINEQALKKFSSFTVIR